MKKMLLFLFVIFAAAAAYGSGNYDSVIYTEKSNLAVEGYDPVAFFEEGSPVEGNDTWKTEYEGALWLFSSEKNLNLFLEAPDKYAPAYGGYCAWAMSEGKLAPGRPAHWIIIDGRLFLNYNKSTHKKFLKDTEGKIRNADKNWPAIESELAEGGS